MNAKYWMQQAILRAKKAEKLGEVPVGAVVVQDGKLIAGGYNRRETNRDALCHAELIALHRACKRLGGWRLQNCDLYVTLEPCPMCAGAIVNARIRRVYIGAWDPKAGAFGSVCDLNQLPLNHHPEVNGGLLEEECRTLLQDFFRSLREQKRKKQSLSEW